MLLAGTCRPPNRSELLSFLKNIGREHGEPKCVPFVYVELAVWVVQQGPDAFLHFQVSPELHSL
jgi:hypothetical protein